MAKRNAAAHVGAAKQLLAHERASFLTASDQAVGAGRVYETLHTAFAPIIGAAAVSALFTRSIQLTRPDFLALDEALSASTPGPNDRSAQIVATCLSKLEPSTSAEVATALYATFLEIMSTFIGERLVVQIMRRAFPAVEELYMEAVE